MKGILKIFAAFALLFSASAMIISPNTISSEDNTVMASVELLYNAIYNSSNLEEYIETTNTISGSAQQQVCQQSYNAQSNQTLTAGGNAMRQCMYVTDDDFVHYFSANSIANFHKKFVHLMYKCSLKQDPTEQFGCYSYSIADMLKKISSSSVGNFFINKQCVFAEFQVLIPEIQTQQEQLATCFSQVPANNTMQ